MNAGRELDALVAEKVFGYHGCGYYGPNKPHGMHQDYDRFETPAKALAKYREHWPSHDDMTVDDVRLCHWKDGWGPLFVGEYSDDISAAWDIVERFHGVRCFVQISSTADGTWTVQIGSVAYIEAATMPLALCHAALIAAPLMPDWPETKVPA